jgi:sterol desaturase/sphingolipid hydroxylase (fatty acid hydroxylase superfamily)
MSSRLLGWLIAGLIGGAFCVLSWLERLRPLRVTVEPGVARTGRNLTMAMLDAVAIRFTETPAARWIAALADNHAWGLVKILTLPRLIEFTIALLLLDYTLYIWHILTHRVPLLWRFHLVHHVDLDLDASTAMRFHFGEMILSVVFRLGQIFVIGVSPWTLSIWQTLTLASVLFHHSNVRLPRQFERRLNWVLVAPRMHGIHHSASRETTDSNWSSGLTVWDRLHGTLRLDVPDDQITIGVPAYRKTEEVGLREIVVMPFGKQRAIWEYQMAPQARL